MFEQEKAVYLPVKEDEFEIKTIRTCDRRPIGVCFSKQTMHTINFTVGL